MTHTGKKAGNTNCLSENPDGGLSKVFKATIIKMFKKRKETMFKELKEYMMIVSYQRISIKR